MTIRVATIGTGYFSQYHYDGWSRIPGVTLEAVCTRRNEQKLHEIAQRYGARATYLDAARMLDEVKPDLVDIITTPESHLQFVELAAQRGIPAICQKPLAPSLEEARRLVAVAKEAGSLLIAHENWRFKPWFREVRRLIDAGRIGAVHSIAFRMRPGDGQGPDAYLARQPYFQRMPRFLIHETGIHMVDVFRFLVGEVTGVFARLRRLNPRVAGEDAGYVVFDFASASGVLDANRLADFPARNPRLTMGALQVEGLLGTIRLDGEGGLWVKPHGGDETQHSYRWEDRGYSGDCVYALQAHVVAHLRDGAPVENAAGEYLRNIDIEDAIYRSNDEQRWVDLDVAGGAAISPSRYATHRLTGREGGG
ncbi:MAG: Gfo/Idh/MocA family oxidoreductase [Betaproteobacteria bacterium]